MEKNYYLTGSEQMVYNAIKHAELVTLDLIREMFPDLSTGMLYKVLYSLNKKGYLYRLKRNLYLIQKRPAKRPVIENPYRIALALYKGYIGLSSALRHYNLIEYEPFTIFVVTTNKSGSMEIGNYTIQAIAMGKRAMGMLFDRGIYVSNIEKTFFDCFYKPQYCGGYESITKALYEKRELKWKNFLGYFESFASSSLCQRTGYVLDIMNKETDLRIPDRVIKSFKKRIGNKARLIPTAPSRGKYSAEWNLLDNLGKERMLGWYYGY